MKFWTRIGRRLRRIVERLTDSESQSDDGRDEFIPDDSGYSPSPQPHDDDHGESRLPDGWVIAGLYHDGERTQRIHATNDTDVTESQIVHADAIIVWYVDGGDDGYKWIHGASSWDSIADQIARVIKVVSPTGTGS